MYLCARPTGTFRQTRLASLLHPLMPETMDWVVRLVTLSGE